MTRTEKILTILVILLMLAGIWGIIYQAQTKAVQSAAPAIQKYRYLQRCGDSVTAEYIATERLPESVVCGEGEI